MDTASKIMVSASVAFLLGGVWYSTRGSSAPPSRPLTPLVEQPHHDEGAILTDVRPEDGPRAPRGAPLGLTASDGTGLTLASMVARAEVQDPLAFTELHLTFENPAPRQIEGTFRITLPRGASVSRFAMKIGNRWQEGEVVEKQAARVAYEDFLHRRQDPALLEQAGGNEFSARVFPIPPSGTKEILISYSQELQDRAPYTLPLQGLPKLGLLDVAVSDGGAGAPAQTFVERAFVPNGDFVLEGKAAHAGGGLRARNMVLAKVKAEADRASDPVSGAVVLVDTSASRALGYVDEVELVGGVVRRLAERHGEAPFRVAAFDQVVVPVFTGAAKEWSSKEMDALEGRLPLGASNLERALDWAGTEAKKAGITRVVVVGDGVTTAGSSEGDAFQAALSRLKENGVERVDAVAVGGIQDTGLLHRVVSGNFAHDGVVIDGALGVGNAVRRLEGATLSKTAVDVPGATWFWPAHLDGVQAGDEVSVYADVAPGAPFQVTLGGKPVPAPELRAAEEPLLERAFYEAKIASLVDAQAKEPKPERKKEIIDLSVEHRVLSPFTALLVLETEQDYARFKIDRKALKDVLSMQTGHLTVERRSWPFDEEPQKALAKAKSESDDKQGGTGTRAKGEEGSMGNPASARPPSEEQAAAAPGAANGAARVDEPTTPAPPPAEPVAAPAAVADMAAPRPAPRAAGPRGMNDEGELGVGSGGGGAGEGIGLGNIGTIGHGAGTGSGQGFGNGHGRLGGSHQTTAPQLRQGAVTVSGRLPPEVVQRIVRQNFGRFRLCYEAGLRNNPNLQGRVTARFTIAKDGSVGPATDGGSDLPDQSVVACVLRGMSGLSFPQPDSGEVTVSYPINFSPGEAVTTGGDDDGDSPNGWNKNTVAPWEGKFRTVMTTLQGKDGAKAALDTALAWHKEAPGDVLGLVALGASYEADGARVEAARAYGSLIDLFSARADLRRFAGERLEHVKEGEGLDLAIDTFEKAVAQRPDHPASHRLLGYARLRKGDLPRAFDAVLNGALRHYPEGRFEGVDRILREDLGLIGAAWIKKDPSKRGEVMRHLAEAHASLESGPSIRFVLNWETDANDVDFHIMDAQGGHAYYAHKELPSGGELYADVTTGYGPECFTIRKPRGMRSGPYKLQAHYYSRGPMGYGMGKLEIIEHDGAGGLTFDERPFVVMVDHAFVDMGTAR